MRFLFLAIILFPLSFAGALAQTVNADVVLEKTASIYEGWEGAEVKFTAQIFAPNMGAPESVEGAIQMKKNKFVLTTPDMTVWFDGKTQWVYNRQTEEVHIATPSGEDLRLLNPMLLLQDYKKDFTVICTGESTSANAKTAYDLTFTPKKKETIEKIEMQVEKNSSLPAKLVVTMRNGLRSAIVLNELKPGKPADELFTFPKASYPDAEIIDLR